MEFLKSDGARTGLFFGATSGVITTIGLIVGLNSALRPFPGPAAQIFPAVAKLLFVNPFVPRIFSGITTMSGRRRS